MRLGAVDYGRVEKTDVRYIRRFVWYHTNRIYRILHRVLYCMSFK